MSESTMSSNTSVFRYTDHMYPASSVVGSAFYNESTRELAVFLKDSLGFVTKGYVYADFPQGAWDLFATAQSKGAFYNMGIKATYGPAVRELPNDVSVVKWAGDDEGEPTSSYVNPDGEGRFVGEKRKAEKKTQKESKENYVVTFNIGYTETEANISARNDREAERKFVKNAEGLGLEYEIVSITREF